MNLTIQNSKDGLAIIAQVKIDPVLYRATMQGDLWEERLE